MKAVVTGAGGQVGCALIAACPAGISCVGLDRSQLDLCDERAVGAMFAQHDPDIVINAAAYTAVDKAEQEPDLAHAVNAEAPGVLARRAAEHRARLVHISTDFVFDGQASRPYLPTDPTNPQSAYGLSKLRGEQAVQDSGADAIIVRTAWVYAASGTNFLNTMLRLMSERDTLGVVADQVGTPTHAASLAYALWNAAARAETGIVHWTDAGVASWYDFAVAIQRLAVAHGRLTDRCTVHPIRTSDYPTPARRPAYSVLDKTEGWAIAGMPRHWQDELLTVFS